MKRARRSARMPASTAAPCRGSRQHDHLEAVIGLRQRLQLLGAAAAAVDDDPYRRSTTSAARTVANDRDWG